MTNQLAIDLLREWDAHNRPHACWYDSEEYDGYGECPSRYDTLGHFLIDSGLLLENYSGQIFGRSFDEPNFRLQESGNESTVDETTVEEVKPLSIRQARINIKPRPGSSYYRDKAEKAKNSPVVNNEAPWEVEAMEFFKNYLDRLDLHLHNISMVLGEVSERVGRIEDAAGVKAKRDSWFGTNNTAPVEKQ